MENIQKRMKQLAEEINQANIHYYKDNSPLITDREYDSLFSELKELEAEYPKFVDPNSPTFRVGNDLESTFDKVEHTKPMLSISNSYSLEDCKHWMRNIQEKLNEKVEFSLEPKIDGLSLSLHYKSGKLIKAVTRGNGTFGDDVTLNAKMISDIPLKVNLNYDFEVRGEVYMEFETFEKINSLQFEKGLGAYANPRNLAAGSLKQKNPKITKERELRFMTYYTDSFSSNYIEEINFLESLNFNTIQILCSTDSIDTIIHNMNFSPEKIKSNYNFPIDGMVLKVVDHKLREKLGYSSNAPKFFLAWKMEPDKETTVVESISYQIGRTGVITPVANLKPVILSGSTIRRATMHNFRYIREKDIRIGSVVEIEKAGEIIPQITKVIENPIDSSPIVEPLKCPVCGNFTSHIGGEVALSCTNMKCPSIFIGSVGHFIVSMGMKDIGGSTINSIVKKFRLNTPADIYNLTKFEIMQLDGFGERKTDIVYNAIQDSKNVETKNIYAAFGIPLVGGSKAEIIADRYPTLDYFFNAVINAGTENIELPSELGPVAIKNIREWLDTFYAENFLKTLIEHKVFGKEKNIMNTPTEGFFAGKTFCLTGTLSSMGRKEASAEIEKRGGKTGGLNKNIDYLIVGEKAGSKLQNAKKLGVQTITDEEFINHLKENN
jgi:DNA ligase (NAD+)